MQGEFPPEMPPEMMIYHWWADNYNFTPKQVREEVDLDCFTWIPVIEEAINRVKRRAEREAAKRSDTAPTRRILGR